MCVHLAVDIQVGDQQADGGDADIGIMLPFVHLLIVGYQHAFSVQPVNEIGLNPILHHTDGGVLIGSIAEIDRDSVGQGQVVVPRGSFTILDGAAVADHIESQPVVFERGMIHTRTS